MSTNPKIPDNYQTVMPYLIVKNADKFSSFIQHVFDAKETYRAMRDENCIMHAELMIGGSTIMFADSTEQFNERTTGLFIYVDHADERFKKAIEAGAGIIMEPADHPYDRSGGILDPFGNTWWITTPI